MGGTPTNYKGQVVKYTKDKGDQVSSNFDDLFFSVFFRLFRDYGLLENVLLILSMEQIVWVQTHCLTWLYLVERVH